MITLPDCVSLAACPPVQPTTRVACYPWHPKIHMLVCFFYRLLMHTALVVALTLPAGAQQGTAPSATTDDTFLAEPVAAKKNLEPAISRPAQEKTAVERLAALKQQHGHAPNIVLVVLDNVG